MNFDELVQRATAGLTAYEYQRRVAASGLPDLLCVPTGTGKTLAATLPWLYRRTMHPDPRTRASTPRWLVIVLPQRALVEQTVRVVSGWLANLGSSVPVHVLMGGEDAGDSQWRYDPATERIFVGTQDMVLSRVLMRGFAEAPGRWPMTAGLLNNGVQFVFDEVQLLGPGLPTSLQLQGFRERFGTAVPCRTMWMSATVDQRQLATVDFDRELSKVDLDSADRAGPLRTRLEATRTIRRLDVSTDAKRYPLELAAATAAAHREGGRTIVLLNTVERATAVYEALTKQKVRAPVVLLHSRFRPPDRAAHLVTALTEPAPIVVTTQVIEAGVDITSSILITESAPWPSIVQRAGRCNRDGLADGAQLLWTPPPDGRTRHLPYEEKDLALTEDVLTRLAGREVTSDDLTANTPPSDAPLHPVLRRRDLLDLFDTTPDLTGNDIDVSRFVRDQDNRTVHVAWRPLASQDDGRGPVRDELCPAPIGEVRQLVKAGRGRLLDRANGQWRRAVGDDVRPTAVIMLDAEGGGYLPDRGFSPASHAAVDPVEPAVELVRAEALDLDRLSVGFGRWVPLAEHLADVEREVGTLLGAFGDVDGLDAAQRAAIALAGRYHDLGKAHPTFQRSLAQAGTPPRAGVWAKSASRAVLRHQPPYFRHELVTALLLADDGLGLLAGVEESDLVVYLAQAHHGRLRVTVRGKPGEPAGQLLGVCDGDRTLPCPLPDGSLLPPATVSLQATEFGDGSLTARALALRDRLGPFRLAFCEAVLVSADWRASRSYEVA